MSKKKSITTVGIYVRPLRAILNEAIEEGIISKESHYPFSKRKYQIPSGKNIKKALSLEEISKLYYYEAIPGSWYEKAKDFFMLSYLANGINIKDIALLKYHNIDGEYIRFNRAKTLDTNRTGSKPISIFVSDDIKRIIDRWKTQDLLPERFLFDILQPNLSPDRERDVIKQFTKMVNKYLKLIAFDLEIDKPITSYFARHSFATILKRSGISIQLISESLGHSRNETTASYLDSFDDETRKEINALLSPIQISRS